jgi:hypothetical protein
MLHVIYIAAFAILTFIAISNLIRNLLLLGSDARRDPRSSNGRSSSSAGSVPHPEMLDERGRMVDEPLLVMRSINIEDAREQLDELFESTNSSDAGSDEDA